MIQGKKNFPKSNFINYNKSILKENQNKNSSSSQNKSNNFLDKSSFNESSLKGPIQINYLPQLNKQNLYEPMKTTPNIKNSSFQTFTESFKSTSPLRLRIKLPNRKENIFRITARKKNNKNFINFRQSLRKSNISEPKANTEMNNYFKDNKIYNISKSISNIKTNKNTSDYEYNLMIRKLDNWDKAHCFKNKDDLFSLYNTLSEYYKKNNLVEDLNNLNYMDSMLREKINYYRYKENKTYDVWGNIQSNNNNKSENIEIDEKNKGAILSSLIINNFNKDNDKNTIDFYNKMMKERMDYENQLHHELILVNNIILNKKYIKKEKNKELNKVFIELDKIKSEFNQKKKEYMKMYYFRVEQYTLQYDSLVAEKLSEIKKINEELKDPKEITSVTKRFEKKNEKLLLTNELKDLEFMHKNKISIINAEMKRDMDQLKSEYKEKFGEVNERKEDLELKIKIINNELNYYKTINEELLREHELYYLDILKKGNDCRKEGLVWVVKNLLELQVNLEYHHFPKYLTHEHINYLKKLAFLTLEENELKIILKILKKKQKNNRENENSEYMNLFDTISSDKIIKDKNELKSKEIEKKEIKTHEEELLLIKKEIDKKFFKVYKDNEEILKSYFAKSLEEEKLQNFFYYIKKALYGNNNHSFLNHKRYSIIDAFMGKTKNKELFELIINITKRLEEIEKTKKSMMKREKDNYIGKFKNSGINQTNNYLYNKELIKNCLFGNKIEF